jgi:hypothetical protein
MKQFTLLIRLLHVFIFTVFFKQASHAENSKANVLNDAAISENSANVSTMDSQFKRQFCSAMSELIDSDLDEDINKNCSNKEIEKLKGFEESQAAGIERTYQKNVMKAFQNHPSFKDISVKNGFYNNILDCKFNSKKLNTAGIGKYYYYLARTRGGLVANLQAARQVEEMYNSIENKHSNKLEASIQCDHIKMSGAQGVCNENKRNICPVNKDVGQEFVESYKQAYE